MKTPAEFPNNPKVLSPEDESTQSWFVTLLKRHSLVAGLLLMFLLTWPIDLAHSGILPVKVPFGVYILLGWGFIVASLVMTWATQGKRAAVTLVKRFAIWRVSWHRYAVALLLLPAIFFTAVVIDAALTHRPIDFSQVFAYKIFGKSANLPALILPFFLFDALTNGEEMGWRGYVLPRLQQKYNALAASLILGLIWGLWHLPKYLPGDLDIVFGVTVARIMVESILYTWLYNHTGESLLLVTLFHASGNAAGAFLPFAGSAPGGPLNTLLIATGLEVLLVIAIIGLAGSPDFSKDTSALRLETGE